MLVEIIRLRREGVKLSPEEVKAGKPLLAELQVDRAPNGRLRATLGWPWLQPSGHGTSRTTLEDVRLVRMRGKDFLLAGLEQVGYDYEHRQAPQAWWCRIPADGEVARPAPQQPVSIPIPVPERWQPKDEQAPAYAAPATPKAESAADRPTVPAGLPER